MVRDPQINKKYFIECSLLWLQCAHEDVIQGSSKLKNYSFRYLFKPLRLSKIDSFWIRVCAILAVSGLSGDNVLISLSFFLDRTFSMILL